MTMNFLNGFLLVLALASIQAQAVLPKSECMRAFFSNRTAFDVCLTHECFIFRDELPFVFLDPTMKTTEQELPFPCIRQPRFYPKLRGAFFETLFKIATLDEAYCLWSGPDCSFDGELDFLKQTAVTNPGNTISGSYKFIVGGLLFVLSDRLNPYTFPSQALLEDRLHILGPPQDATASATAAWSTIWEPFTIESWIFIFTCIIGHTLARVWISFHFSINSKNGFSRAQFRARLLGHYYSDISLEDDNEENWKQMDSLWVVIAKLFIGIMLILWEVAIAVKVFERTNVEQLTNFEPEKFAITRGTTMDRIARNLMDLTDTHEEWKKYNNLDQVYEALKDPSNNASYTLSYEIMNRHKMNSEPDICATLRKYDKFPEASVPSQKPPSFTGVWFYSSNLNASRRLEIDNAIVGLKEEGKIEQIVDIAAGGEIPDKCLSKSNRIEWTLIAMLLIVLPGLPFFVFLCQAIWCFVRSRWKPKSKDDDDMKNEEFSQPSTSADTISTASGLSHFRNTYSWA